VTPTIFGSTVGYPSDSLASCLAYDAVSLCVIFRTGLLLLSIDLLRRNSQLETTSNVSVSTWPVSLGRVVIDILSVTVDLDLIIAIQHSSKALSCLIEDTR